ncbi:MAG: hypothetical protein DMF51_18110 [Acidobacteria bacterium]|nr:MAG: hypothetical protein DMF51_18110 [Acidobacteriota bacterium]
MEFLSLQEPVEQPAVKLSRAEAVFLSVGLHLLLLLLFLIGPGIATRILPESIVRLLAPRPPLQRPADETLRLTQPEKAAERKPPRIPMQFAYVRIPDDNPTDKNPNARLLSDKSRRARQEVATPPGVKQFSIDPHSQGDTIERIRPDPRLKAGRDTLEPPSPQQKGSSDTQSVERPRPPADPAQGSGESARQADPRRGGEGGDAANAEKPAENQAPSVASGIVPPAGRAPGAAGGPAGVSKGAVQSEGISPAARESLQRALSGAGEESKKLFDNPAYLMPSLATGTMSFDTQDFPWGDYARKVKIIIENHWVDRLPLAFREGIRGYTCAHFVIEKSGTISGIDVVRQAGVPPFDRAVSDALRASSPLPPLPKEFPEDQEGVSACFFYNMLPGEIRGLNQ